VSSAILTVKIKYKRRWNILKKIVFYLLEYIMWNSWRTIALGAVIRAWMFRAGFYDSLVNRVEISTPINSWKRGTLVCLPTGICQLFILLYKLFLFCFQLLKAFTFTVVLSLLTKEMCFMKPQQAYSSKRYCSGWTLSFFKCFSSAVMWPQPWLSQRHLDYSFKAW